MKNYQSLIHQRLLTFPSLILTCLLHEHEWGGKVNEITLTVWSVGSSYLPALPIYFLFASNLSIKKRIFHNKSEKQRRAQECLLKL